jgi:adenylate kinase family enzyme
MQRRSRDEACCRYNVVVSSQDKVHVFGASGSGTTTLGRALATALGSVHLDADTYFWQSTDPPFTQIRPAGERVILLGNALQATPNWVLSGSVCGWGDAFKDDFTLAVFLYIPMDVRMRRILERDQARFGARIERGGDMYEANQAFIEWASKYDTAGLEMRSRTLHEQWVKTLRCPVLRIEYDAPLERSLDIVQTRLADDRGASVHR